MVSFSCMYQYVYKDLDHFNSSIPATVTSPIPGSSTYPPATSNPAMKDFNRGIKRDPHSFRKFNNERYWSDYQDHTIVTANSQNVEDVLNTTYVPVNRDDKGLITQMFLIPTFLPS